MQQPVASTQELAQELVFREHQIALLQVEASMLAAELLQNGFLEREGVNSPTDWLRFNCHLTDAVAGDRIRVGEHLAEMHPTKRHQATRRALARYRQKIDALTLELFMPQPCSTSAEGTRPMAVATLSSGS